MCLSIKRFSKSKPDFLETTGSSGTSPDTVRTTENITELDHENERFNRKRRGKVRESYLNSSLRLGESFSGLSVLAGKRATLLSSKIFR